MMCSSNFLHVIPLTRFFQIIIDDLHQGNFSNGNCMYVLTSMRRCFACCTSSCSWPPNMLRPIGNIRFRQATFKLDVGSIRRAPRLRPFLRPPIWGSSGSLGVDGVDVPLSWLGMISAILSISLANTKFCSSFLNI